MAYRDAPPFYAIFEPFLLGVGGGLLTISCPTSCGLPELCGLPHCEKDLLDGPAIRNANRIDSRESIRRANPYFGNREWGGSRKGVFK